MLAKKKITHILYFICIVLQSFSAKTQEITLLKVDSVLKTFKQVYGIKINNQTGVIASSIAGKKLTEKTSSQNLLIHKGGLMVHINGTGALFRLDSTGALIRTDSTFYQGSSFGSIFTEYNDTLLLMGGYGFWNTTAAIRYFKEKFHEWDVFATNKNIEFATGINAIAFEDRPNKKIYLIYRESHPEYLSTKEKKSVQVECFDLNTKKWQIETYKLNKEIGENIDEFSTIAVAHNGLIMSSKRVPYSFLLNFRENTIYKIKDELIVDLIQLKNKIPEHISFATENKLHYYDYTKDTLFNIVIQPDDLRKTNLQVFAKNPQLNYENVTPFLIAGLSLLSIGLLFGLLKARRDQNKKNEFLNAEADSTLSQSLQFESFLNKLDNEERLILEIVVANQKNNEKNTSIQEINSKLGIEKKPIKIQNNIRASYIGNINKKFSLFTSANEPLIERIRSDFDKRFFEYRLNKKTVHLLAKWLGT